VCWLLNQPPLPGPGCVIMVVFGEGTQQCESWVGISGIPRQNHALEPCAVAPVPCNLGDWSRRISWDQEVTTSLGNIVSPHLKKSKDLHVNSRKQVGGSGTTHFYPRRDTAPTVWGHSWLAIMQDKEMWGSMSKPFVINSVFQSFYKIDSQCQITFKLVAFCLILSRIVMSLLPRRRNCVGFNELPVLSEYQVQISITRWSQIQKWVRRSFASQKASCVQHPTPYPGPWGSSHRWNAG
jgi:hypothetical protein